MNILHISSYYMKGLGYQENCLSKFQKKAIPSDEGDVLFYTSERSFPFLNFKEVYGKLLGERIGKPRVDIDEGVRIIREKPIFESKSRCSCVFDPFNLYKLIKEENIDIIHLHGATNLNLFSLLCISYFCDFKLFIDCHSDKHNSNVTRVSNKLFYSFYGVIYKLFNSRVAKFLAVTRASQDYLYDMLCIPKSKIIFTPLCFDHESMYFDAPLAETYRRSLGGAEDTVYMGYFGKISPEKNVLTSLKIFNDVQKKYNSKTLVFLLVGDGNKTYMEKIKYFVKNNQLDEYVVYLPLQGRVALKGYLSLCSAAFWIGSASNCIQEAMACKTVPFLSKTRVIEHLIFDERQNIDIEYHDAAVRKVASIINDGNISDKIQSYAMKNYTWKQSAEDHIKIYKGII